MKRSHRLIILLFFIPFIMAMSSLGGDSPDKIPVPAKKFLGLFVDQMDVITDAKEISIDGGTFLEGKKGEGTFTVAFENIQYVNFLLRDEKLIAVVKLREGSSLELVVNKKAKAYGKTKFGAFQIKLLDLKRMTITNIKK